MKRAGAALALLVLAGAAACGTRVDERLEGPTLVANPSPFEFPLDLWDQGVEGETILLIHVTDAGEVDSTVVHTSSGFEAFDSAAVRGALDLRFSPARMGNNQVSTWVRLPVRFLRDSARVDLMPQDSS